MVIILRGISGSGKSRLATLLSSEDFHISHGAVAKVVPEPTMATEYTKSLWGSFRSREHKLRKISADDYFMINGEYKFDPKYLGAAHTACLREFHQHISDPKAAIIVDNTNCTLAEFVPYAALANAFNHELHIITLLTEPIVAWKRGKHGVPFSNVVKQAYNLQDSIANWPSWFPQQIFPE